jgi:hypothetical protein
MSGICGDQTLINFKLLMDLQSNPTHTRIASVFRDKNDVIVIRMKNCGIVDEFDVLDLNLVIRHKCEGIPRLKLFIADGDWDMDKKAKERVALEEQSLLTKARAVVVSSKIKATVLNYLKTFIRNKSKFPVQFFNSEEEAYNWLLSVKDLE